MPKWKYRIQKDSMGDVKVPENAYWGPQTQRAIENFSISGLRFPRRFLRALGMVKMAAAKANKELGRLEEKIGEVIIQASQEVMEGKWDDHFVVDVFQTGSGTSTNMNANEVISNRANEILGGEIGEWNPVHPNDHVNCGQSSNDVIPSCKHISALEAIEKDLLPALKNLYEGLTSKAKEFDKIVKIGRTHLQGATPIRLGQEFSGYASRIQHGIRRLENVRFHLSELAIGGTAVGTGINTDPEFAEQVTKIISNISKIKFREAENHFEAQAGKDAYVETSGALKTIAVSLMNIGNDIRWLGSDPRSGIGEIIIPEVQPGSSIMPGKINPVIVEALCMVAAQVIGNDTTITLGGSSGNFELNVMMPMMAYNLLQSIDILSNALRVFNDKCIIGIKANVVRNMEMIEKSLAMSTVLVPYIGYDAAAEIAKEAYQSGKTVREIAREKQILPEDELEKALNPMSLTKPG